MPRQALAPGSHSSPEVHPYAREPGGRLRRAESAKFATAWRARATFRGLDGRYQRIERTSKTKTGALEAIKQALDERTHTSTGTGSEVQKLRPSMSFIDACKVWTKQIDRTDSKLSAQSRRDYQGAFDRYIDADGSMLRPLTLAQANRPAVLRGFLEGVADAHGTGAAKQAKTVIANVLNLAVRYGVLDFSAARSVGQVRSQKPRKTIRDTRRSLTREERNLIIIKAEHRAQSAGINPRTVRKWETVADVAAFMAGTGVRVSEARLLLWEAVDLQEGMAQIDGTKTHSSKRRVDLPDWLTARLRLRAARLGASGHVFAVSLVNGSTGPLDQSNLANALREVLDDAGCEWATPHAFRRTVATDLHDHGVTLRDIADQLGHKDASMTAQVYLAHDFGGPKKHLAEYL